MRLGTTYLECTNQTVFLEGAKLAEACVQPHVADNVSSSNAVCPFNLGRVCPDGTDLTQYSNLAVCISDGSADEECGIAAARLVYAFFLTTAVYGKIQREL